jgi:hypothetical protein
MKYFMSATPGPMPPSPEQFDAAIEWLEEKVDDDTFDLRKASTLCERSWPRPRRQWPAAKPQSSVWPCTLEVRP